MDVPSAKKHQGVFRLGHKGKRVPECLGRANQDPSDSFKYLEGTRRDKSYQEELLARQKSKIGFGIRNRGPLGALCEVTCEVTCEEYVKGRSCNTPLTL